MNKAALKPFLLGLCVLGFMSTRSVSGEDGIPKGLMGDWTLQLDSKEPAWLSIAEQDGKPIVRMRVYIGSDGPFEVTKIADGKIHFPIKSVRAKKGSKVVTKREVEVGLSDGKLDGTIKYLPNDGTKGRTIRFTGKRIPLMPTSPPDLSKVRFGKKIELFNGQDLTGWRPHEQDKKNGWSAKDGLLVNTTPKTDFSATGDHANLRTEAEFEDFRLHIEFLVEEQRNSGIYLRGMYEAQVVDRDSRMQGIQGVGAIFGRIAPSKNAGNPGGHWQAYDLTLFDRHITVVLNGEKVIDNQPIIGPTAGAIYTDPSAPGPIYLQGDHTNVKYRNIILEPVVRSDLAGEPVKHLFVAKLLLRRFETIALTDQQMSKFNNMSRDLRARVDKMRAEAEITKSMIKRRDEVFSELKKTDLGGDALWNTLQEKMQITDEQRDAFRETHEANKSFRANALKLLTAKQRAEFVKGAKKR
ncbi:MAG: family 16 glycoside hydrolase [Planctomycetota bacterium]